MSVSQLVGTSQRKSARLEKKKGDVVIQDLPGITPGEGLRTFSREEGDDIVFSRGEPTLNNLNPEETTGQSGPQTWADPESEEDIPVLPMVPST
jgi:hypothetical protein